MTHSTNNRLVLLAALCGFTIYLALGILHHEAWRDEWQAINIARAATSLPDLYARLRYEGHPVLWFLCIRAAWEIYPSLLSVQILNSAFALAAAGLVGFLAPWPLWLRLMVACTGPAAWEYSIKARGYGLGWLIIVALAMVLRHNTSHLKKWLVILLAILALNASVLSGFVAFALVAGWLWEEIHAKRLPQVALPIAILALAALGTLLLSLPPPDALNYKNHTVAFSGVIKQIRIFTQAMLPCDYLYEAPLPAVLFCAVVILFSCFGMLCRQTGAQVALACGWLSINVFMLLKLSGHPWYAWHLFLVPVVVAIAFESRATIPRTTLTVLAVLAAAGLNCGIREYVRDWKGTYSAAKPTALAIKTAGMAHLPIVVSPFYYISSLSGYLGRPLYDDTCGEKVSYVIWQTRTLDISPSLNCAIKLAKADSTHKSLITLKDPIPEEVLTQFALMPSIKLSFLGAFLADFEGQRQFKNENFYVYLLTNQP